MSMLKRLFALVAVLTLAACGGGSSNPKAPDNGGGDGGATDALSVTVRLVDTTTEQATSSIVPGAPVRAEAVLRRNGEAVRNEIVQFAVEQSVELVKVDPSAASVLTDSSGKAVVTVTSLGANTGAGRISASAKVGTLEASSSANFFASASGATPPSQLTLGSVQIGSQSVSAYGTTGVSVQVLQDGQPYTGSAVTVNFSSSCPAGKASINSTATTQPNGVAVATFVDNGCAANGDVNVSITASIATSSRSGTVLVKSPSTGSLQFVSVVPADKSITLRGQGGSGRQENATVTFKLVDVAGNGVSDTNVCFDVTTYIGGLNIDGFSPDNPPPLSDQADICGSSAPGVDREIRYIKRTNSSGVVSVQINSGTVPTPVRVRARAVYPAGSTPPKETYSDTLSVSTGLPLQRSFSLSVDNANIDGGDYDGVQANLTVRLADQFSNPVPDNTVVNFVASGGAVCTSNNGSCRTTNGTCSCAFTSQARRPLDGRVVVTAYAVGLEDYNDTNADNQYTPGVDEFTAAMDLGDAYVDANKDGVFGDGAQVNPQNPAKNGDVDIPIPYQNPNKFKPTGDGVRGTAHIRASTIIFLSRSSSLGDPTMVIPNGDYVSFDSDGKPFIKLPANCPSGTLLPEESVAFYLDDGSGNPMAAGSRLTVVDVSENLSVNAFRPSAVLAIGARPPGLADLNNQPKTTPWTPSDEHGVQGTSHTLTIKGVSEKCSGTASFGVQVESPRGSPARVRILFEGEPRGTERFTVPVKYVN